MLDREVVAILIGLKTTFLLLFLSQEVLLVLHQIRQPVQILLQLLNIFPAELAVPDVLLAEPEIGPIDVEIGTIGAVYLATEPAVMLPVEETKLLPAAFALTSLLISVPVLSRTEPRPQLLPKFLPHHEIYLTIMIASQKINFFFSGFCSEYLSDW